MAETTTDPTASESQRTFDEVRRRAIEANELRDVVIDGVNTLRELWTIGPRRFHGDHWSATPHNQRVILKEGLKYSTINRTQSSMISAVAVMTERPMRVTFQPIETADEGIYFAKPKATRMLMRQMSPETAQLDLQAMFGDEGLTQQQIDGQEPFTTGQYEALVEQALVVASGELGLNPLFKEDDFFKLTDATAGEAFQVVYDALFDRANGDAVMAEHALMFSAVGTQFLLLQWNFDKRCPQFINIDIVNVRPDPVHTMIADSDYLILDQVMPMEEAIKTWPKSKLAIETASTQGKFQTASSENEVGGRYQRTNFGREMVQVRTMWERGVEYDLADPNDTENPHHAEGVDLGYFEKDEESGQFVAREGALELVDPDDPSKGTRQIKIRGIRQIVLLPQLDASDSVVEDERCPYADIPVCQTVNIPILGMPYGIGEPQRLEGVQMFINQIATTLITHLEFYRFPQEFWPQGLLDIVEAALGGSWYQSAGVAVGIPDDKFKEFFIDGKRTSFAAERPELPGDMVGLMQLFFDLHDQMSGNVSVLQGRPPSADSSGVAIQELQQQARGPIGYKSAHMQESLKRLGMLMADAIIKYLPEWDWTRYLSKYPSGVAMAFRDRIKSLRFDISAEVVSGKGVIKEAEKQTAIERRAMVPPSISEKTLVETLDNDPERELKRLEEERAGLVLDESQAQAVDSSGTLPGQPQPA